MKYYRLKEDVEYALQTVTPEGGIISSMYWRPECIERMRRMLKPEMFSDECNRIMFETLIELNRQGNVDLIPLRDYLREKGLLKKIGGVQYLVEMVESIAGDANADYYANIIRSQYITRQIEAHKAAVGAINANPEYDEEQKSLKIQEDFRKRIGDNVEAIQAATDPVKAFNEMIEDTIAGKREAIPLPWAKLNTLTRALLPGTVTLLCGSPGASKSFMLLQAICAWIEYGKEVVVYELEEDSNYHLLRILAQQSAKAMLTDPEYMRENPALARTTSEEMKELLTQAAAAITTSAIHKPILAELAEWVELQARKGKRIICIDPITIVAHTRRDSWNEDTEFLEAIKHSACEHGSSIILVTHPTKMNIMPSLETLAGGASYGRLCQTAIWLENHRAKSSLVKTIMGTSDIEHNRTLHILKARNGKGQGMKLAYNFETSSLTLSELGVIQRDDKR